MKVKDLKELARIIALAQDIREESYVPPPEEASSWNVGHYDCGQYSAAHIAAAQITRLPHEHVIVEGLAQLVCLLNSELWNDVQAWNADILKLPEEGDK